MNRCTHAGCEEAKLVHLHMKTCPAGQDFPCPTRHQGCLQARKLLTHYKRCRTIRARQAGQPLGMKSQHACLICSMVARQARAFLDASGTTTSATKSQQQGPVIAHKKSSFGNKPTASAAALTSTFTLSSALNYDKALPSLKNDDGNISSKSMWKMPPPAPRVIPQAKSAPVSPMNPILVSTTGSNAATMKMKSSSFSHLSLIDPTDQNEMMKPPMLQRKRSESLDAAAKPVSNNPTRMVTFCSSLSQLEESPEHDPLVSVELETKSDDITNNLTRRVRSASCHLLSPSKPLIKEGFGGGGDHHQELGNTSSGEHHY